MCYFKNVTNLSTYGLHWELWMTSEVPPIPCAGYHFSPQLSASQLLAMLAQGFLQICRLQKLLNRQSYLLFLYLCSFLRLRNSHSVLFLSSSTNLQEFRRLDCKAGCFYLLYNYYCYALLRRIRRMPV